MILWKFFCLAGLASAGLLFTKKYSQPLVLDQEGHVEYKFYNVGQKYKHRLSLFASPQMTNIDMESYVDSLLIEANETKSVKIPIKPIKSSTYHDLPAKLVYHVKDDNAEHISWSSVNGKVLILSEPVKAEEVQKEDASERLRIKEYHVFWLFSSLSVLIPTYRYQRIVKHL